MSETRYDKKTDRWEVVVKMNICTGTIKNLQDEFGVDAKKEVVTGACEMLLITFAREMAKTGLDKNLIAAEVIARGVDKTQVGIALGLDNPVTA